MPSSLSSFLLFLFPLLISADILLLQNMTERNSKGKPVKGHPFPAKISKHEKVVYDNGDTDYTIGFDFVVSPGGARLAAVYDDFLVEKGKHLIFDSFQTIVAIDSGRTLCSQYSPSFQIYTDSPNGAPTAVHGPFVVKTQAFSSSEHHQIGTLYYFTVHFTKTSLPAGHYWFKFTSYCMEQQSSAFAMGTATVKNEEGWITTPDYTGPISSSPFVVPPHDFAYALILKSS